MDCPPPGPENEAGRPNSYGQPKVQHRMRIKNDDYGADDYNSHDSDHNNDDVDGYNSHGSDHDNDDADYYNSHVDADCNSNGSDHDNDGGGDDYDVNYWRMRIKILLLAMLDYWLAPSKTELTILPDLS